VNPVQVPKIRKVEQRQLGELKRQRDNDFMTNTPMNEPNVPMGIGTSGAP